MYEEEQLKEIFKLTTVRIPRQPVLTFVSADGRFHAFYRKDKEWEMYDNSRFVGILITE